MSSKLNLKQGISYLERERGEGRKRDREIERYRDREIERQRNSQTEQTIKIPSKAGYPN